MGYWPRRLSLACVVLAIAAFTAVPFVAVTDQRPGLFFSTVVACIPALVLGLLLSWRQIAGPVGPFLSLAGLIPALILLGDATIAAASSPGASELRLRVADALDRATSGDWMLLYLPLA